MLPFTCNIFYCILSKIEINYNHLILFSNTNIYHIILNIILYLKMRIAEQYLTPYDISFLKEIKSTKRYHTHLLSPLWNDDQFPYFTEEEQKKCLLEERKKFAKWKLKQKRRELEIELDRQRFEENQKREILLFRITMEKRALYSKYASESRPRLVYTGYGSWRPFWELFYQENTIYKNELKLFTEDEMLIGYDDITFI